MPARPHRTEPALIALAKAADRAALGELIGLYWERVTKVLIASTRRGEHIDDLVQNVFLKVSTKIGREFEEGTNFEAWVVTIARFEALAWKESVGRQRKRFAGPVPGREDEEGNVEDPVDPLEQTHAREAAADAALIAAQTRPAEDAKMDAMKEALMDVPALARDIAIAKYGYKRSVAEIAAFFETAPDAVEHLYRTARAKIEKVLVAEASADAEPARGKGRG